MPSASAATLSYAPARAVAGDRAPRLLGEYVVGPRLGCGGMGVVYRARQLSLERDVALKVLAPWYRDDPLYRMRFLLEARAAATVEHPYVVPVYGAGCSDGWLYLAMRLIEGPTLRELLAREGRLDAPRAVELVGQLAAALDCIHARGLVHRDVKPSNVLIGDGVALLADFGLALQRDGGESLTGSGSIVGTLDYVAPEVLRGEQADARADVYALGCVLYELLAGKVPFADRDPAAKIASHLLRAPAAIASAGSALNGVLATALAKWPQERYASASALAAAARQTL